jgi:hypothetical protein
MAWPHPTVQIFALHLYGLFGLRSKTSGSHLQLTFGLHLRQCQFVFLVSLVLEVLQQLWQAGDQQTPKS